MIRRTVPALAAVLAALALSASPALAKGGSGGGGGGKTPAPAPAPDPAPVFTDVCEGYWDMPLYPDGGSAIVNRTSAGCVIVRHYMSGLNQLDKLVLLPGWTYDVLSNGAGTSSRVQIDFSGPGGQKASIRVEAGKTDIR
jgi:hypothetical protein